MSKRVSSSSLLLSAALLLLAERVNGHGFDSSLQRWSGGLKVEGVWEMDGDAGWPAGEVAYLIGMVSCTNLNVWNAVHLGNFRFQLAAYGTGFGFTCEYPGDSAVDVPFIGLETAATTTTATTAKITTTAKSTTTTTTAKPATTTTTAKPTTTTTTAKPTTTTTTAKPTTTTTTAKPTTTTTTAKPTTTTTTAKPTTTTTTAKPTTTTTTAKTTTTTTTQKATTSTYTGEGTYYGAAGINGGACSYHISDSLSLPFIANAKTPVALNAPQWANSASCGTCLMFRSTNSGCTTCGSTPITSEWTMAVVTDKCPECSSGDLDLAKDGDGRWNIEWYTVPCSVGTSFVHYALQGSNRYYLKIQVSNSKWPVSKVELNNGSGYQQFTRSADNYFISPSGQVWDFPMAIRVTSSTGETLVDQVNLPDYGTSSQTGKVQFS